FSCMLIKIEGLWKNGIKSTPFFHSPHFFINRITYKIELLSGPPSLRSPHLALIFASFLRFMQANVSPAFISIRAFPNICVYRNP
ncbi:hypothetical protein AALA46_15600, partial [Enterocloster aldenensis]